MGFVVGGLGPGKMKSVSFLRARNNSRVSNLAQKVAYKEVFVTGGKFESRKATRKIPNELRSREDRTAQRFFE